MKALAVAMQALQAYVDKDRSAIESVIGSGYRFTSPLDNALDRETYFERCWPNSAGMTGCTLVQSAVEGEWVWIVYEASTATKRFRNVELHRVRDGRIAETQVYFGRDLPHRAPAGGFVTDAG